MEILALIPLLIAVCLYALRPAAKVATVKPTKVTLRYIKTGDACVKLMHDTANNTYGVWSNVNGAISWKWYTNKGHATLLYRNEIQRMHNPFTPNPRKTQVAV